MAHNTDKVGFPSIPLRQGMVLKLEARDPTSDTEVAGVTSTRWSIYGSNDGAQLVDELPLYTAEEVGSAGAA